MSISVVINTYNSAKLIGKVLDSVKHFDEIVVCDMESTDKTVEVARQHGAKVVTFPKENHTCCEPARNYAISNATSDWVLVLDADELVPQALRRHLYKYINSKKHADALFIPRKSFILDRFRSAKYPDYQLRFFRSGIADWPPFIHSQPVITGKLDKIPANKQHLALFHIPHSMSERIQMLDSHTTAEVNRTPDKKISIASILMRPLGQFANAFFLKGGFRYGLAGYIAAMHDAIYIFYRKAKIYEAQIADKIPAQLPEEPDSVLGEDE